MKKIIKSYFTLTRKERIGFTGLIGLILIFFIAGLCVRFFVHPAVNLDEEKLNMAWQKLQESQNTDSTETATPPTSATLFVFDPNTLDSAGFIRLGLSAKTTRYLLNWRNKGKHFYKKEDLKPLYSLSETEYQRLAPYISIAETRNDRPDFYQKETLPPLPAHIDLNKIDSATLVRLDGIGTVLAHKIVERRRALGSFLKHEQLLEIYKFPDSTYQYLKEKLPIAPANIKKINLNTATEEQLAIHPYIGEKMAKNIILLRSGLRKYEKTEQLRQVPLMVEEKYRKIAPYCIIE